MTSKSEQSSVSRRWFGRAVVLGGGAAVVTGGGSAEAAAPPAGTWWLTGNSAIATDGSQFVGTRNVAPLVFKTTARKGASPAERMRITPTGVVQVTGAATVGSAPHVNTALTVQTGASGGIGVLGTANNGAGATGVYGTSNNGIGVHGSSLHSYAVYGTTEDGAGVRGECYSAIGGVAAVSGEAKADAATGVHGQATTGTGVEAVATGDRGVALSVVSGGQNRPNGAFIFAEGTDPLGLSVSVIATQSGGSEQAAVFNGDVEVNGALSKPAGSFKIDHPLDPANRYLYHSFVESPDMMTYTTAT